MSKSSARKSNEQFDYYALPAGTVLAFKSTKNNTFRVKLLEGFYESHSRHVEVLEAPIAYHPTAKQPTIMCVVPPKTRVEIMAHAYFEAIATVSLGDIVYLMDPLADGSASPFIVRSVEVEQA